MTRQELERLVSEARSTAEMKAWRDMLALVDLQREMYGADFESAIRYRVCNWWQAVTVKG